MTATVLPARGASSVVLVEGVALVALPFVWLSDGGSSQTFIDRMKETVPSRRVSAFDSLLRRYAGNRAPTSPAARTPRRALRPELVWRPAGVDQRTDLPRRPSPGRGGARARAARCGRVAASSASASDAAARYGTLGQGGDVAGPSGYRCARALRGMRRCCGKCSTTRGGRGTRGNACEVRKLSCGVGRAVQGRMAAAATTGCPQYPPRRMCAPSFARPPRSCFRDVDAFLRRRAWSSEARHPVPAQSASTARPEREIVVPPGAAPCSTGCNACRAAALSGGGVDKSECRRLIGSTAYT